MKKITLSNKEEIELTEREAKIHGHGFDEGMSTGALAVVLVFAVFFLLVVIFS